MNDIEKTEALTAEERVVSIVAYLGTVAEQQDGYARASEGGARWHTVSGGRPVSGAWGRRR